MSKVKVIAGGDPKHLRKYLSKFHQNHICTWSWECWLRQKVKRQGHSTEWPEKPGKCNILVTTGISLTKIRSHMYMGLETLVRFSGQRST